MRNITIRKSVIWVPVMGSKIVLKIEIERAFVIFSVVLFCNCLHLYLRYYYADDDSEEYYYYYEEESELNPTSVDEFETTSLTEVLIINQQMALNKNRNQSRSKGLL